MKVEGRPHADQDRHAEPLDMVSHPALLFRRAETNPHDVWGCLFDPFYDQVILQRI
jgi:hypothetical protein